MRQLLSQYRCFWPDIECLSNVSTNPGKTCSLVQRGAIQGQEWRRTSEHSGVFHGISLCPLQSCVGALGVRQAVSRPICSHTVLG